MMKAVLISAWGITQPQDITPALAAALARADVVVLLVAPGAHPAHEPLAEMAVIA